MEKLKTCNSGIHFYNFFLISCCFSFQCFAECKDIDLRRPGFGMYTVNQTDQGKHGSCFAHTAVKAFESALKISRSELSGTFSASPASAYVNFADPDDRSVRLDHDNPFGPGGDACAVIEHLSNDGVCSEEDVEGNLPKNIQVTAARSSEFLNSLIDYYENHREPYIRVHRTKIDILSQIPKAANIKNHRLKIKEKEKSIENLDNRNRQIMRDLSEVVNETETKASKKIEAELLSEYLLNSKKIIDLHRSLEALYTTKDLEKMENQQSVDGRALPKILESTILPHYDPVCVDEVAGAALFKDYSKLKEELDAVLNANSSSTPARYVHNILNILCKKRVKLSGSENKLACKTFSVTSREISDGSIGNKIDTELQKGKKALPVIANIAASVLLDSKFVAKRDSGDRATVDHSVLIVGTALLKGQCYYIVRNSWGPSCENFADSKNKCEHGDLFVKQDIFLKNLGSLKILNTAVAGSSLE